MSYTKMMKWNKKHPRGGKSQYMGFNLLGENERRNIPWLGSYWFEPGMDDQRHNKIKEYQKETERLLKINPNLKLI
jgi:hypothetical protein